MLGEGEQAGRIKVLDFGLAKIVEPRVEAPSSIVPTAAAGTAPITGEGPSSGPWRTCRPSKPRVGRSTDDRICFRSAWCSMRWRRDSGHSPATPACRCSRQILKDTPRSVTDLNPALPRDLGRIIRRALAKDPERRYQSAKDLRNDSGGFESLARFGRTDGAGRRHRAFGATESETLPRARIRSSASRRRRRGAASPAASS
jgi:serine/threonine protein kinase